MVTWTGSIHTCHTQLDSKALADQASVDLSLNNLGSSGEVDQETEEVDRGTCSSWPFNRSSPCDGGDAFEMYTLIRRG